MPQTVPAPNFGNIALTVALQEDGLYTCEASLSLEGQIGLTLKFPGQSPKHAIAIALENLAQMLRREAEAEQNLDWEAVDRTPSGEVKGHAP